MSKNIALTTFAICVFAALPAFALPQSSDTDSETRPCKEPVACDYKDLQLCKRDIIIDVCPYAKEQCPIFYFDWTGDGEEHSVDCNPKPGGIGIF